MSLKMMHFLIDRMTEAAGASKLPPTTEAEILALIAENPNDPFNRIGGAMCIFVAKAQQKEEEIQAEIAARRLVHQLPTPHSNAAVMGPPNPPHSRPPPATRPSPSPRLSVQKISATSIKAAGPISSSRPSPSRPRPATLSCGPPISTVPSPSPNAPQRTTGRKRNTTDRYSDYKKSKGLL